MKKEINYEKKMKELSAMGFNTVKPIYWGKDIMFKNIRKDKHLAMLDCDTGRINVYEL